jgi:LPS-assembly lipoprotein
MRRRSAVSAPDARRDGQSAPRSAIARLGALVLSGGRKTLGPRLRGDGQSARRSAIARLGALVLSGGRKALGPRLRGDGQSARRSAIARLGALVLSGGLAACGFRLRGTQQLPFAAVFVEAPPTSAIGPELQRSIRNGTATRVVDDRAQANAVVEITGETRERDVLSVNAQGQAREFRSRLRVVFRVRDSKGREYLGPTTVTASRDLFAREEQLLAREYEEAQLYQDMLIDVAQQILRRLSALKV